MNIVDTVREVVTSLDEPAHGHIDHIHVHVTVCIIIHVLVVIVLIILVVVIVIIVVVVIHVIDDVPNNCCS